MICNVWKLYFAIKDSGAELNDIITIEHKGSGEYIVKKSEEKKDTKKESKKDTKKDKKVKKK